MSNRDTRTAMRSLVRLVPEGAVGASVVQVARDCGMGERRTAAALRGLLANGEARRRRSWGSPYVYTPTATGRASQAPPIETTTYTLDDDQVAVLRAMKAAPKGWMPCSCEHAAEDAGIPRARALRALLGLVELRLVKRRKGSYGRVRYDLTPLGEASSLP